jgi:hypothetical protein
MHAVAVVFDFVQPAVAIRRGVDQLRELRRNPRRSTRPARTSLAALVMAGCTMVKI